MKFSERIGRAPVREAFQIEDIDDRLSTRLWNDINLLLDDLEYQLRNYFCTSIWTDFFVKNIDELPLTMSKKLYFAKFQQQFKCFFYDMEWFQKYDLIEFIADLSDGIDTGFSDCCNESLQKEMSGYSIINNKVTPIIDEIEIQSIEMALNTNSSAIQEHLDTALAHLSNRETPDYRNAIKESISAVESICKQIVRDDKDTLGKALDKIDKSHQLPEALKSALKKLYGYTSDASGIRHGLIDDDREPTMEEARFMLITCSAFINYLKTLSSNS